MPCVCRKMYIISISFQLLPFVCHSSLKSAVLNDKPNGFLWTHYGLLVTFMTIIITTTTTGIISIWIPKYNSRTSKNNDVYFTFFITFVLWVSLFSFSLVFRDAKHPLAVHLIVQKFLVPPLIRSLSKFLSFSFKITFINFRAFTEWKEDLGSAWHVESEKIRTLNRIIKSWRLEKTSKIIKI